MKNSIIKIAFFLIISGFTTTAHATKNQVDVPEQVITAFAAKFPNAQLKKWEKTATGYKASFKFKHEQCAAFYAADGTWLKSTTNLHWTWDMPKAVNSALKKGKFASFYEDAIKEVTTNEGTQYVLTVDNHNGNAMATEGYGSWEDYRIVYDSNGNLISAIEL